MEIFLGTKEEHNRRREEAFLKLTPGERLIAFIEMVTAPRAFPLPEDYVHPNDKKNNFEFVRRMESNFNQEVYNFIDACQNNRVRMILVGGNAVNYYGYKRHSSDIDFWIDNSHQNLDKMLNALRELGNKLHFV